jgi:hypothetical protein
MTAIRAAIANRRAASDTGVAEVDLTLPSVDFGCDWHPQVSSHEAMAEKLEEAARAALGW